eukprot:CAMPEP_0197687154 /NCGR_PEP_ID=MMETSP1338-20131121/103587_1 /TAXON_ID=43686 ORGANISM="Pelagodinium beii, Strain RCC1491" /NCGR_SAMPLE_ID=MMETSP1338 /ASSEMBLY_ACC=CAM_ASM_000754 /LENGTH=59 /DNA_ID=CAMNT_0043269203 /DNA_START=155 /DNA_END=334 /DNA_ORIENTATION=+
MQLENLRPVVTIMDHAKLPQSVQVPVIGQRGITRQLEHTQDQKVKFWCDHDDWRFAQGA